MEKNSVREEGPGFDWDWLCGEGSKSCGKRILRLKRKVESQVAYKEGR